jgi:Flp pilus assembly protein TadD
MPDGADNNRVRTADRLARIEEKLDRVASNQVRLEETVAHALEKSNMRQKEHSGKLDEYGLAIARLEQGERERAELRASVEKLKTEQRIWTGLASFLAALGNFDIGSLFRG